MPVEFTDEQQAELNRLLAEDRRKTEAKHQKQIEDFNTKLKDLEKNGQHSKELQTQIEELKNSFMSKEQIAAETEKKLQEQLQKTAQTAQETEAQWRARYEQVLVESSFAKAGKDEIYSLGQITTLLRGNTKVVEVKDDQGKGTGKFDVLVAVPMGDKVVELAPEKAFEQLRTLPEFANQFKTNSIPGLGTTLNNTPGQGTLPKGISLDTASYMRDRAELQKQGTI